MKIAFFEIQEWEKKYIKQRIRGHTLAFFEEPLTEKNIKDVAKFDILSIFIYSKIDAGILKIMPNLKMISTRSTGFDHIDLKACKSRNVCVLNVPFYGENTVAEHTFGLMLSLSRNIHKAYLRTTRKDYSIEGLIGFDLKGKTLGIIGTGHIGAHVARIAKGFEINLLGYDKFPNEKLVKDYGIKYVSLKELLNNSDIITIHTVYTKETHHLINRKNITQIKNGALLINTARGAIVETEALIDALNKKILAGVGIDVLEGEDELKEEKQILHERKDAKTWIQLAKDHVLLSEENVIFTPHIAFYSQEALERILDTTVLNINSYMTGKCMNVVI